MKALAYASAATNDKSSPLYGKINMSNTVLAGHSMGASDVIQAGYKLEPGTAKVRRSSFGLFLP